MGNNMSERAQLFRKARDRLCPRLSQSQTAICRLARKSGDGALVRRTGRLPPGTDQIGNVGENLSVVRNLVIQNACCKKAFIRGAFLAAGSLSDPEKFYHFEIVCASLEKAVQLQNVILTFDIDAKIVVRKKYYVVYIKEGSQIVELLGLMEAHVALMELGNIFLMQ